METVVHVTHPWERAGLGKAPFRYVGMFENVFRMPDGSTKAGGSCDYCGTGIRYCFRCVSADDKSFVVGCDCIARCHTPTEKIVVVAEKALKEFQRAKRSEARAAKRREAAEERQARWSQERDAHKARLATDPLYLRLQAHAPANDFLRQMLDSLERWGNLSEKQEAAAVRIMDRIESEPARKAASQYLGAEGDRVTLTATVDFVRCTYAGRNSQYDPDRYIVKLRTDDGSAVTWFTTKYCTVGQRLTGTAKIRRCEEYNGEKQTVITNPRWKD